VVARLLKLMLAAACAVAVAVAVAVTAPLAQAQANVITVQGSHLLRDGVPWTPRGVQIVGDVAPDAALSGKYVDAHAHFGVAELQAAVADHADLIRFQVSEFGLDPLGPLYSPAYVQEVQSAVDTARSLGLGVIVSLQAEPPAGEPTRCPLPDGGAQRAWGVLAPMFAGDGDVMFELYNEPGVFAATVGWIQWRDGGEIIYPGGSCQAVGMQGLVNQIRAQAPQNVIIVPSPKGEQTLAGRVPIIDPAHRGDPQLAYGIHYPSLTRGSTWWDKAFGAASAKVPVIVTEWDANSTTTCVANSPAESQLLLDYLASKEIGIVGFAFDLPGTIVADYSYAPTSYAGFACGVPGGGPGQMLFGYFAAEAQAGDGTSANPSPAWIVSGSTLTRLTALDAVTTGRFFNSPRTFVTGATPASLAALGDPAAIPTQSFADAGKLIAAVDGGHLRPGTVAVVYAPAGARTTPVAQQRNPGAFFTRAAQAAHAHGLLLIAAPAVSLVHALAPLTPMADWRQEFLRLRIAAGAARSADVFDAPAQGAESSADDYNAFVQAASKQAARAHPGIEQLAAVSTRVGRSAVSAATLFDAVLKTRLVVSGYELDPPTTNVAAALGFLDLLGRLG
jgi:hypothetical protein